MCCVDQSVGCRYIKARLVSVGIHCMVNARSLYQPSRGSFIQPWFNVASPQVCTHLLMLYAHVKAVVLRYIHTMPRSTARQARTAKIAPCLKCMRMLHLLGCGMPFDAVRPKNLIGKLSVLSKEATWHMISKGFQNGISQFEKKIRQHSPVSFHSFCNLKKVYKKLF